MSEKTNKPPLYFICLIPPTVVKTEVKKIKKELQTNFGVNHALKLEAHITIQIPFRMPDYKEDILIKKLLNFADSHKTISAELDGFGRFAKNVIFINVIPHEPFIKIHAEIQDLMLNFLELKSHEISTKIHPHITLATRDLKRSHFPEIWEFIQKKEFNTKTEFRKMQLLKHNGKVWESVKSFNLVDSI